MPLKRAILMIAWLALSQLAHAHSGGVDGLGGHINRRTDEYHCHKDPCFSTHRQVIDATLEAETEEGVTRLPLSQTVDTQRKWCF
jgi:hypothetical protein